MVEIGESSFSLAFSDVEHAIRLSSFIAVDLEFLGLPSANNPNAVSLFDIPAERYKKLRTSVKKFPPCQLGVACFKEIGDRFEVDVFCFYLFKRLCNRVFSFSISATTFLSQNNFDFNKFIGEGVTYLNRDEYAKIKREIINNTFDFDTISDKLERRLQLLKMRILLEASVEEETEGADTMIPRDERVRLSHPLLIELCMKDTLREDEVDISGGESEAVLWDSTLSALEAAAVIYALGLEFPHFDFQLDHSRTLLYVAETPLIFRNGSDKKRHKANLKSFLNELLGVSRVFHCITENRKPLIGHNSLLDFLYIYNYFEADLPETYEQWKTAMMTTFPTIIDTKILAASLQEQLSAHGVHDLTLQTLANYIESPSCGVILPFNTPNVIPGDHMPPTFEGEGLYHNAGYDALMTGKIFIKMAHLYAYSKCSISEPGKVTWPLQKLLILLKPRITGRIPTPLIDSQHCYMGGDDPPGQRPDIIQVKKRRRLKCLENISVCSLVRKFVSNILCLILPPAEITKEDCLHLQDDFSRVMGSFRVEVRSDGSTIFLATNTPKSFARVCSFFIDHDDYYLVDDAKGLSRSYEQRLTAHREQKDSQSIVKRSAGILPYVPISSLIMFVCLCYLLKYRAFR